MTSDIRRIRKDVEPDINKTRLHSVCSLVFLRKNFVQKIFFLFTSDTLSIASKKKGKFCRPLADGENHE
mgnify:CR=1 FL=1